MSRAFEQLIADGKALSIQNAVPVSGITPGTEAYNWFVDVPSSAGVAVNETTAMKVAAVYACVSKIAGGIATLPLPVYQRSADGRQRVDHDYWHLLNNESAPAWTAASFWEYLLGSKLLRGDGLAEIKRNRNGIAREIEPLDRKKVLIESKNGRLFYSVYSEDGIYGLDQDDVIHVPGFGFNGITGMSVISHAAKQGIGIALAADEYSASFFANGARPDFALTTDQELTEDQQNLIRKSWESRHKGAGAHHKPAVLQGGLKVENISMSAEDSQLIDTRRFQVMDICTAFGVPPHLIGSTEKTTSWGTGLEELTRGFVKFTLRQHINRIQQEINRKLFTNPRDNFYFEFNVDGFMEGDSAAQADYFSKALGGPGAQGYMTINEVRKLKNLPPIPGGDEIIRAGNNEQSTTETAGAE